MMKLNFNYFLLLIPILLFGCNKKYAEPDFQLSEPEYSIDISTNAGKRAMDYYNRTKTFILYKDVQERDFGWNFFEVKILAPTIVEIKDNELDAVLDFLDANLFSYYADEYMLELFPYRIPIADSIYVGKTLYNYTEGEASILLSNLSKKFAELPSAQQKTYLVGMHNVFLNLAAKKLERKVPAEFFELSDYNFTTPSTSTTKPNPKELGFWSMPVKSGQTVSPTRINDMIEWVKTIAKYSPEDIEKQFYYTKQTPTGPQQVLSQAMVDKYNFLQNHLKNQYKTDLHKLAPIF